jgi:chitinase
MPGVGHSNSGGAGLDFVRPVAAAAGGVKLEPGRTPSDGGCDKKVVCHYLNRVHWRTGEGKYNVEDIDPSLCSHIVYAFAVLDTANMGRKAHDTYLDLDSLDSLECGLGKLKKFVADLKRSNSGAKLLLAVGGWTDSPNNKLANKKMLGSPENRAKFIRYDPRV